MTDTNTYQAQANELSQKLWAIANDLRGQMDASEFKNYILGVIFYRYLSERTEMYMIDLLKNDDGITYEEAFADEEYRPVVEEWSLSKLGYVIKPENLFRNLIRKITKFENDADKFSVEDFEKAINDLVGSTMGHESNKAFDGLFNDMRLQDSRLGETVADRTEMIGRVMVRVSDIDFDLQDSQFDVLGTAYMILIGLFASDAGKKGGEFFTPAGPSKLCATLAALGLDEAKTVGDCTCGSASMLLEVQKHLTTGKVGHFYGQELNATTYNLSRMNMIMHGIDWQNFDIYKGDTLKDDKYGDIKMTVQVCNPPYSLKWSADKQFEDDPRYSGAGKLAPKGQADLAFVEHMIYHMDEDDGRVAVLLPHGVLFRGGAEETIRKYIIKDLNRLDAVIGLPANLFHGTGIPVCVLVLKCKRNGNAGNILFIDASKEFKAGKNQNVLEQKHIDKIVEAYVCFEKLNIANVSADIVEYIFDNCCFKLNDCMVRNVISYKKKNLLNMFENQPYSTIIKLEYQPLTEYVHENMKEYIEAVVLKKTIIEDEKEDIIDLLRRNLEESDLCASVIRLENFEIEKLADCLEQEIQNKRDKVKVVWNTLLEQNKIGISWENTMLYWKYYSISNYLKKFIEVNVDKLSVEKNNYVTDNFAKDIINAKFEDSVLKKLLPVLPMKTFDLDVEQLPENILAIMVECNYFGYTIEYYQSIAERNEDIAVEYIVKNQAEFYNSLEDFPMTKNVLERLLFEQKIPMDNREELFEKYAKTYMTERIALNMNAEGFKVTKTLFDIAWEILSENQKERLMIANLELLNVDDMEKCFGELSGQYSVLSERTKRCKVKLDNTENNRKLVNYLEKIGYITSSWEEKTDSNGQVIIIGCRIKQKR